MRLHRFYLHEAIANSTTDGQIKIDNEDLIHQWRDVFRYTTGAQVVVFDGDGYDYLCMIAHIYNRTAELAIVSKKKSVMPEHKIALALSMIKKDNMELVIQKATELGVSEIFPIVSERSEKKSLNMARAKKIAVEASEQSGRGDVPSIHEPVDLDEFFKQEDKENNLSGFETKIACDPSGTKKIDKSSIKNSALICIGPEGGYSEKELELFKGQGFAIASLGSLVLRAETAAIAVLAILQ